MHIFHRLITAIFLTVISVILLFSAAFAYLIVTPLGGKILLRYFKQEFVAVGLMHVSHYEGSLQNGVKLKDITIKGLSYLPNALLRIQEVHVRLPLWDPSHFDLAIFNARILLPDSDPIVFTGDVYAGQIKGDLYAKSVDIHEASRFWTSNDIRNNLQGFVSDGDFKIQGPLSSPEVNGTFLADSIRYRSVLLTDGFSRAHLTVFPSLSRFQMMGDIIIDSGLVDVRNVDLQLSPSKLIFQGDVFDPILNIRLGSKLRDLDIHLAIIGTVTVPQLIVSSDPPMAPQDALNALFTGNAWVSSTSPFNGVSSTELAENFLNYSLQDINDQQQVGFKTKLTENLKLGAEMDQLSLPPGVTNNYYSRKINGEFDLNDHMSLNVSKEVFSQERGAYVSSQDTQSEDETQIYLQYKKRF